MLDVLKYGIIPRSVSVTRRSESAFISGRETEIFPRNARMYARSLSLAASGLLDCHRFSSQRGRGCLGAASCIDYNASIILDYRKAAAPNFSGLVPH